MNVTVSGTAASAQCNVPPSQIIALDGAIDATVSLCNNADALPVFCSGYPNQSGFATGQFYTQPSGGYATVSLNPSSLSAPPLYAVPFINPNGGAVTSIGIHAVTVYSSPTLCELGVYDAAGGVPTNLLKDAGTLTFTTSGTQKLFGLNLQILPNRLYFLVVACNAKIDVTGTGNPTSGAASGPIGLIIGEPDYVSYGGVASGNGTNISGSWSSFTSGHLPTPFPGLTYGVLDTLYVNPNVYLGP